MSICVARTLSLPLETVTRRLGVIATTGAGKTYLLSVMAEEFARLRLPFVVIDPEGVCWGIRSSSDGKRPGYPVVILGGDHADAPLEKTSGRVIADWIVDTRQPAVLDLSDMRKNAQTQFVADFAEQLFDRNKKKRDPIHVFVDEADRFAPQRVAKSRGDKERCLGAMEDLSRRGRQRGIGCTLLTQRSSVINKNVLDVIDCLVVLKTGGPRDRKAIDEWLDAKGGEIDRAAIYKELPSLEVGQAYFWSPGWLRELKRVKVRKRTTFDSSKTPEVGKRRRTPKKIAKVDLKKLTESIAETIERKKQEDPSELRKELARVTKQYQKLAADYDSLEKQGRLLEEQGKSLEQQLNEMDGAGIGDELLSTLIDHAAGIQAQAEGLVKKAEEFVTELSNARADRPRKRKKLATVTQLRTRTKTRPDAVSTPTVSGDGEKIGRGPRRILVALAQRHPKKSSARQVRLLSGFKNSGSFSTYISKLRGLAYLEGTTKELEITNAGLAALGDDYDQIPQSPEERLEFWCAQFGQGPAKILRQLYEWYPERATKDELLEATGYANSGSFSTYLSKLRTADLVTTGSEIGLREDFFS